MTELQHDLPEGMVEWVSAVGGGAITRLERHVARREAWVVDVTRADGSVLLGFLRLERVPAVAGSATSLFKETIDASTLAGCALIVASGLIILWTNRRAAQT